MKKSELVKYIIDNSEYEKKEINSLKKEVLEDIYNIINKNDEDVIMYSNDEIEYYNNIDDEKEEEEVIVDISSLSKSEYRNFLRTGIFNKIKHNTYTRFDDIESDEDE